MESFKLQGKPCNDILDREPVGSSQGAVTIEDLRDREDTKQSPSSLLLQEILQVLFILLFVLAAFGTQIGSKSGELESRGGGAGPALHLKFQG